MQKEQKIVNPECCKTALPELSHPGSTSDLASHQWLALNPQKATQTTYTKEKVSHSNH